MLKRTPLHPAHLKLGGRLVEFGGWEMPVQYTSITDEHQAVRTAAGLFDISHMGEVRVSGAWAMSFLNHVLTNDLARLHVGEAQYTLMCNERGGVIDDLYAYRVADTEFWLIINASRIEADVAWLQGQLAVWPHRADVILENVSESHGAVAVQGPAVAEFINDCFQGASVGGRVCLAPTALAKNQISIFPFAGEPVMVARTGYTGEDGFEVVAPAALVESLWGVILEKGEPYGLKPAGLGARDTLRTEVGYPLYGHELDEETTPIEAGLGYFVANEKSDFVGRAVLAAQKTRGAGKKCVAFKMTEKSPPPRPNYPVWSTGTEARQIGLVTSGTQSPSLGIGIGLGYVPAQDAAPETPVEIEIRGKRFPAVVVRKPIYRKAV